MIRALFRNTGFDPRRFPRVIAGWRRYLRDRERFRRMMDAGGMSWGDELPMLTEWDDSSGALGGYFFQDITMARWIHEARPQRHVDVGSRLDGFIGHLAVFREVEVLDIRPQPRPVPNVRFHQLDLMADLPEPWREATDSLSCLHTIEHFGLGRYGDTIDPEGHLKGIDQLKRMVAPGGMLYLSTPVGEERVEFNAHRIFAPRSLISWFPDGWRIEKCAVIDAECRVTESPGVEALAAFSGDRGVGIVAARKGDNPIAQS
jgi:hypothetical protein